MKHLLVCSEYPPAPSGGIGTYALHFARLLAEHGEIVHVIGPAWKGADRPVEESVGGRLIVHRVPFRDWSSPLDWRPSPAVRSVEARALFASACPAQCFAWQASLLAERLIEEEGVEVVETQEYDAPLYFFQLRRALGLGPRRRPPCIVHLHSPTELIARHNDWDVGRPGVVAAIRLEELAIRAADALLCPSRYLARQAEERYDLAPGVVEVVPLPAGDMPWIERDDVVWKEGTVCYVGRLEPRKGIFEWLGAAVEVARGDPRVRFDFVGVNVLGDAWTSGEAMVEERIPTELRARFVFHGPQPRSAIPTHLARARIGVVPSRWENFPYTCVEALGSGLPVLASPEGGMAEMIEDGETGWVASSARPEDLAAALRRALETPPARLATMGREAAARIRRLCDNERIVEAQLRFRRHVVGRGPGRSLQPPPGLARTGTALVRERAPEGREIVVVMACPDGASPDVALASVRSQTRPPVAVVVASGPATTAAEPLALPEGARLVRCSSRNGAVLKNAALDAVRAAGVEPLGIAFLAPDDRMSPDALERFRGVLDHAPDVGLVTSWVLHRGPLEELWIRPSPAFPYQWLEHEVAGPCVVRVAALEDAGRFDPELDYGYEDWDLANAILAKGWIGLTVPEVLGERIVERGSGATRPGPTGHARQRRRLLERFPELFSRQSADVVLLLQSETAFSLRDTLPSFQRRLAEARDLVWAQPGRGLTGRIRRRIQLVGNGLLSRLLRHLTR